ncbi:MAG: hypothetical protein RXR06_11465, partial [Thermoproteus sp.]
AMSASLEAGTRLRVILNRLGPTASDPPPARGSKRLAAADVDSEDGKTGSDHGFLARCRVASKRTAMRTLDAPKENEDMPLSMSMAEPSATSVPPPIAAPKSADIAADVPGPLIPRRSRAGLAGWSTAT